MIIKFFFNDIQIKLPERKKLKTFIKNLFIIEETSILTLTYIFCTDKYLLAINKEFLGHRDYTDVITFILSDPNQPIVGEIYISADRVKSNAIHLGIDINKELHRVMFHGALHLCGYNDKTQSDKRKMRKAENVNLKSYLK